MGTVDLNDLGVFVAVVETASFSKAAARLGVPKSSVSRAIARLEDAMGVRVLHRTTRRVAPSTAGAALHESIAGQIASLRRSVGELPEMRDEPSGRLRVTAVSDFGEVMAEVVARYVSRYPGVDVDLRFTNAYVDLVAEGIDVALRFARKRLQDSSFTARKLCPDALVLHASPSYLARRGTPRTPRDLDGHDWVTFEHAQELRLEGPDATTVVKPKGRILCDNMAFQRAALVRGCGIGALPPYLTMAEVAAGQLVRVLPKWSFPVSHLWAVWPGSRKVPRKVSAFLDIVVETLDARPLHALA